MNILTIIIIFSWCYISSSKEQEKTQQYVENKLTTLQAMINSKTWSTDISQQIVIFSGRPTTLTISLHAYKKNFKKIEKQIICAEEKGQKEIENVKRELYLQTIQSMLTISKLIYTILSCLYSDLILKSLILYFYTDKFLTDVHNLKTYTVRIMYILLSFTDVYSNLKNADRAFLFSLMSINVFFYNDLNSTSVTDKKSTIARMINMVERFRCRNCLGSDYYHANIDYNNTADTMLEILLSELNKYSFSEDLKSLNDLTNSEYHEEMYNPTNILLKDLTDFNSIFNVGYIIVRWYTETMSISEIAERAIKSYKIKDMFMYQILFVRFIKDLFCIMFLNLANEKRSSFIFEKTLNAFDVFINQIIPSNYPSYLYEPIKKIKSLLSIDFNESSKQLLLKRKRSKSLFSQGKYNVILSGETKQMLTENTIIVEEKLSLNLKQFKILDFLNAIINHIHFKTFRQMFQLFLSEPNTLEKYRTDPLVITTECNYHEMHQLRKNLFLFRLLLVSTQQKHHLIKPLNGPDFATLSSIEHIKTNLAYVYERFNTNTEIINMFAPLTIYLKDAEYSILKCQMIKQYILLTINLIENYEMNNCCDRSTFTYNLDMYKSVLKDEKLHSNTALKNVSAYFDRVYINDSIKRNSMSFMLKLDEEVGIDTYLSWVNVFVPNGYFNYYDNILNSDIIFWNGIEDHVDSIALSVTQDVIEIDHLINCQTAMLKWLICNILKKILYIAVNINELLSSAIKSGTAITLSTIDADIQRFQILLCPTKQKTYTDQIINELRRIFHNHEDPTVIEKVVNTTAELITLLHTSETGDIRALLIPSSRYSLDIIHYSIQTDIEYASEMIKFITNNNLISKNEFFTSAVYAEN